MGWVDARYTYAATNVVLQVSQHPTGVCTLRLHGDVDEHLLQAGLGHRPVLDTEAPLIVDARVKDGGHRGGLPGHYKRERCRRLRLERNLQRGVGGGREWRTRQENRQRSDVQRLLQLHDESSAWRCCAGLNGE